MASTFGIRPAKLRNEIIEIDYPAMLNGADTINTVVDSVTDAVLMRPLAVEDRAVIVEWLEGELGVPADVALAPTQPEQASALVAAVLISSVYFQLR